METKAVGMRIKQARENANITQAELAAMLASFIGEKMPIMGRVAHLFSENCRTIR